MTWHEQMGYLVIAVQAIDAANAEAAVWKKSKLSDDTDIGQQIARAIREGGGSEASAAAVLIAEEKARELEQQLEEARAEAEEMATSLEKNNILLARLEKMMRTQAPAPTTQAAAPIADEATLADTAPVDEATQDASTGELYLGPELAVLSASARLVVKAVSKESSEGVLRALLQAEEAGSARKTVISAIRRRIDSLAPQPSKASSSAAAGALAALNADADADAEG